MVEGRLPRILRINYEVSWKCWKNCENCYRYLDCPKPEKVGIFHERSRWKQVQQRMSGVKYKLAIIGGKGGVGKSTVSAGLAVVLAQQGLRVGLVDSDFDGPCIPRLLGLEGRRLTITRKGLKPIIGPYGIKVISTGFTLDSTRPVTWFQQMRRGALEEFLAHTDFGELDFLVLDLPPGTGTETLNVFKYLSDLDVVAVTTPTQVAREVVRRALTFCRKAQVRVLGLIENMSGTVCPHCGANAHPAGNEGTSEAGLPLLGRVPLDERLAHLAPPGGQSWTEAGWAGYAGFSNLQQITAAIQAQLEERELGQYQPVPENPYYFPPQEEQEVRELFYDRGCNSLCHDCPVIYECDRKEKQQHENNFRVVRLRENMDNIRYKIAVLSGKGGVGKSTIAVNLTAALALGGLKLGIVDSDFHGPSVPRMLGVQGQYLQVGPHGTVPVTGPLGIQVISTGFVTDSDEAVGWFQELKRTALEQFLALVDFGQLDYLVVDLPAGTNSETVNLLRFLPQLDGAVVVGSPAYLTAGVMVRAVDLLRRANIPVIGLVENMSQVQCTGCGQGYQPLAPGEGDLAEVLGVENLGRLPLDPLVAEASDSGVPFVISEPQSEASRVMMQIAARVRAKLEN